MLLSICLLEAVQRDGESGVFPMSGGRRKCFFFFFSSSLVIPCERVQKVGHQNRTGPSRSEDKNQSFHS